jgi:predicted helicase
MNNFDFYYNLLRSKYDEKGNASGKGRPFEKFIRDFLPKSPGWSSIIKKIWLWEDYPDKWSSDIGIDLIFIDQLDKVWAVQVKCYDPKHSISKKDINSFLSAAAPKRVNRTLLIGTTNLIGKNAKIALRERETVLFLKKDFESIDFNYPTSVTSKIKTTPTKKISPKPYQQLAIDNVVDRFKKNNKGQLIMACGTGKTFTSIWIDQKLKTKHTLILVPTLNLIEKTLQDWSMMCGSKTDIICVCSDPTVSKNIEIPYEVSDLPYPVYTSAKDIQTFLKGSNKKVVISTYLSADVFEYVFKNSKIKPFDLTIFDEAHKCTGDNKDKLTLSALNPKILKTEKSLFMTATPRETTDQMRRLAETKNKSIYYMDDKKIYGERFHELNFGDAIKQKLLNDYQVVILGITDQETFKFIDKRALISISKKVTHADELASTIGFLDCIKKYNLNKIITFHTSKKQAKNFSDLLNEVNQSLKPSKKVARRIITNSVTSDEPVYQRVKKINSLDKINKSKEVSILTNARCLTEGVDIPSLDSVAFISPKRSTVDIIQATGRAIRLTKPRGIGYIIIPFFIEKDDIDHIDEKKLKSNYKYIFSILGALKEHDNILSDSIDQLRIELGRKKITVRGKLSSKIVINLPSDIPKNFEDKITSMIVKHNTDDWLELYGLLKEYEKKFGSVSDIEYRTTYKGKKIGYHISEVRKRYTNGTLSEKRISMYEKLTGWSFNFHQDQWNINFNHLKKYYNDNGNSDVADDYKVGNINLGYWVTKQRTRYKSNILTKDQLVLLMSVNFVFDALQAKWDFGFNYLKKYYDAKGDSNVPHRHKIDGFNLGSWVSNRRNNYKNNKLSKTQIQQLKSVDFIFDPTEDLWNESFNYLKEYYKCEGNSDVPKRYKTNEFELGRWVSTQRRKYKDKKT